MLSEIVILTLSVLASSLEVSKSSEAEFSKDFKNKSCDGYFPWLSTEYKYLGIVPFNDHNTKCIQAMSKSCVSLHPIDFSRGAVQLNVYLQLFSDESALTVSVFNKNNVPVLYYELNRLNTDYTVGWNTISLESDDGVIGYINLKGRTDKGDIIVVDLYQFSENAPTKNPQHEPERIQLELGKDNLNNPQLINRTTVSLINVTTNANNYYSKERFIRAIEGTTQQSRELTSDEGANPDKMNTEMSTVEDEQSEPTTEDIEQNGTTEPLTVEPEDNNTTPTDFESNSTTTLAPELNQTDSIEQDNNTTTTVSYPNPPKRQNNFWSPIMITLVAVGSFVVLAITAVSAYYCGKFKASKSDTDFIVEEDVIPQPIIPRVRNANRFEV